jgi:hypothetical protein
MMHRFLFSHPVVRLCQRELVMAIGGFSNWSDSCFSLSLVGFFWFPRFFERAGSFLYGI